MVTGSDLKESKRAVELAEQHRKSPQRPVRDVRLLLPRLNQLPKRGLVHSFTGSTEEMQRLIKLGLDIGVNGCSLKTEENLAVVKEIPLQRLQIETDGPWCEIRPSHASAKFLTDA